MSRDNKRKYLSAYIPEVTPKETPKRDGRKSDGRYAEIEAAVAALSDMLAKQNRDNLDAMYNIDMENMSSSMRRLFQSYDDGITKTQAEIKTWADEQEAGFKSIAEWQNETTNSISSIDGKVDANSASITLLNQWKGTTSSSLAAVQTLASQNEAKISSLTSWKNTAEGDIDGLAETVAVIEQVADENGASISQIVTAVGSNGKVNAASIVAAVNAAGSSVKIEADHLDVDAIAMFKNTAEGEGVTTINGDDIVLITDPYGDSISGLTFYKWRYTNVDEEDNELDNIFRIRTIDNENDDDNYARFAVQIQSLTAYENNTKYHTALKLISNGAMSLESDYGIYVEAADYINLHAGDYGTRIYARESYADMVMYGVSAERYSYVFCADGIYYVDGDGNAIWLVGP